MIFFKILIPVLASYAIGSIPFGYLIGKMKGIDIRTKGSCNIGATNVTRVIGPWYGKLCFLLDFLKGCIPVWIASQLWGPESELNYLPLLVAAGTIFGHMFSVYLKFTGGKGVSTAGGAVVGLAPLSFLVVGVVWVVVFLTSRYVSLASIAAAALLPVVAMIFKIFVHLPISWWTIGFFTLIAIVAIIKHRANISRLRAGTENKFARKKD